MTISIFSPDSSILFSENALKIARQLNKNELLYKTYNAIGVGYIREQVEDKALEYFFKALELAKMLKSNDWKKFQAQALRNVSDVFGA